MYFVPDGTTLCRCYECEDCGMRFLSVAVAPSLICPYCGEEVERWNMLLSLALTGGDFDWI